jgi:hypothetical protein
MQQRILVWVAALLGGVIVLTLFSLLVVSRLSVQQRAREPTATPPTPKAPPADTAPVAGLPGTTPESLRSDTTAPSDEGEPSQVLSNVGPLDSTLADLGASQRQRTALDMVLRKGIVYQVKERTPNVIRYVVGAPFFSEPGKYRNPLVRDLYHAYLVGRPAGQPLYLEFWDLRRKLGEYVADTFYFGPRYAKPR